MGVPRKLKRKSRRSPPRRTRRIRGGDIATTLSTRWFVPSVASNFSQRAAESWYGKPATVHDNKDPTANILHMRSSGILPINPTMITVVNRDMTLSSDSTPWPDVKPPANAPPPDNKSPDLVFAPPSKPAGPPGPEASGTPSPTPVGGPGMVAPPMPPPPPPIAPGSPFSGGPTGVSRPIAPPMNGGRRTRKMRKYRKTSRKTRR